MADAKSVTEQVEDFELENAKGYPDEATPYPPCLHGLSDDEIKKLGVKTTLKLDLIVMPAMTTMYILNYLGQSITSRQGAHQGLMCFQTGRTSQHRSWPTSWRI